MKYEYGLVKPIDKLFSRGICEVIELMKVDMANFYVRISRSVVEQHSADYERTQFMKLLEKNPGS